MHTHSLLTPSYHTNQRLSSSQSLMSPVENREPPNHCLTCLYRVISSLVDKNSVTNTRLPSCTALLTNIWQDRYLTGHYLPCTDCQRILGNISLTGSTNAETIHMANRSPVGKPNTDGPKRSEVQADPWVESRRTSRRVGTPSSARLGPAARHSSKAGKPVSQTRQ